MDAGGAMPVTSTVGNVYKFTGSLATLQAGGVLNVSLLNTGGGPQGAVFVDDDGTLNQSSDGIATVSIGGGPAWPIDYLGAGTASTVTVLGLKLFPKPAVAFIAGGEVFIHFPSGLPPLSGVAISFDLNAGSGFALPNPMPICLAAGTPVRIPGGACTVESLAAGDLVLTRDHGAQVVRWVGQRQVGRAEQRLEPRLRAVHVAAGALGPGVPAQDMLVTQQHRILLRQGAREHLVAARHLVGRPGIALAPPARPLRYIHLLFDRHEVISAAGCATESLYLGPQAVQALPRAAQVEIGLLFPAGTPPAPARPFLTRREVAGLPRLAGCAG